jgi:hypothetical protein
VQYPFEKFRPFIFGGLGYMHIRQNPININYNDDFNIFPGPQLAFVSFFDQIPGQKLPDYCTVWLHLTYKPHNFE